MFKVFKNTFNVHNAKYIGYYYRIAGVLVNRYHHPNIHMEGATIELAQQMLLKSWTPNLVQARVEVENLHRRNGQWRGLHRDDFPVLDLAYLGDITIDLYQIKLSLSYIQDKLVTGNYEEFQLDEHVNERGFLRVSIYSWKAVKHKIFLAYNNIDGDGINGANDANANDEIIRYYCTC